MCAKKGVKSCTDRLSGNSDVGNTEARILIRRNIHRCSAVGMGTEGSICAPQL